MVPPPKKKTSRLGFFNPGLTLQALGGGLKINQQKPTMPGRDLKPPTTGPPPSEAPPEAKITGPNSWKFWPPFS